MHTSTVMTVLGFACIIAAAFFCLRKPKAPQTRLERKLGKLQAKAQLKVDRMTGRARLVDVRETIEDLNDQRPTAQTINTVLTRRGMTITSRRLVRSLSRILAKQGVIRMTKPGQHQRNALPRYTAVVT